MPAVTIIGAGVFGLSIAHELPLSYDVTIVARDMPGDPDSLDWASPWAGAGIGLSATADPTEQDILRRSFRWFWEAAERYPQSTVRKITQHLFRDATDTDDDLWYRDFVPDYRIMDPSELSPNSRARIALSFTTLVLTPPAYIAWLADRLRARGVRFVRATVRSLADVHAGEYGPVPDVIVNASGVGARTLGGVEDPDVEPVRGQTMLIADPEHKLDKMILRSGIDYCYIIPRLDGTVVIGGIKEPNDPTTTPKPELRADICRRAHELNPLVPADPEGVTLVREIVGFRPGRKTGVRIEKETIGDMKVVHAYGGGGGGYALSAGVGQRVAALVDEFLHPH